MIHEMMDQRINPAVFEGPSQEMRIRKKKNLDLGGNRIHSL